MEYTVVSYNIHSGIGTDGRFDLHRVAGVLQELAPDFVALQEVGDFRGRTSCEGQPELLAGLMGLHMAFGPNVVRNGRRYGNAILSRFPIVKSRNYDLSVGDREPRGALRCDLALGEGRQLHLFSLHLGLKVHERRAQESLLLSADILREAVRKDPVVVCGDFNAWWSHSIRGLVRQAIHDAALLCRSPTRTYPSRFPLLRLDRIYVDGLVLPRQVRTHRTPAAERASDHLPLLMRFATAAPPVQLQAPVELIG